MNSDDNKLNWHIGEDEKDKAIDLISNIVEENIIAFTDTFIEESILLFSLEEENNHFCLLGNEKPDGTFWKKDFDARKLFIDFAFDNGLLEETASYLESMANELRKIYALNSKNRG